MPLQGRGPSSTNVDQALQCCSDHVHWEVSSCFPKGLSAGSGDTASVTREVSLFVHFHVSELPKFFPWLLAPHGLCPSCTYTHLCCSMLTSMSSPCFGDLSNPSNLHGSGAKDLSPPISLGAS